jgi:ribosome-binding factor A
MNERRIQRLQEQIKQRLATLLQQDLADPKLGLVTITRVELDREFTQCKAYWSVIASTGNEERARRDSGQVLSRARGFCQKELGKALHTRTVPHLEFRYDGGIKGAIRMTEILREVNPGDAPATEGDRVAGDSSHGDRGETPRTDPDSTN